MITLPDPAADGEPDREVIWCRIFVDLEPVLPSPLTTARMLLLADIAARARTIIHGQQVRCVAVTGPRHPHRAFHPHLGSPPGLDIVDTVEHAASLLGGAPDITVTAAAASAPAPDPASKSLAPETIRVGPVTLAPSVQSPVRTAGEHEISASRLMLLHVLPEAPAQVTLARQRRADETLDRWRLRVAMWQEMPAAIADPRMLAQLEEALRTVAGTNRALVLLHRLEADPSTPSGAKYAAFMHADRVLGLDLGHLIGKIRH